MMPTWPSGVMTSYPSYKKPGSRANACSNVRPQRIKPVQVIDQSEKKFDVDFDLIKPKTPFGALLADLTK
jgi:hypothetical protein